MSNKQSADVRYYDFDTDSEAKAFLAGLNAAGDYLERQALLAATKGRRTTLSDAADAIHRMAEYGAANTTKVPVA